MKQIQIFLIAFLLSTCGAYAQSTTNVSGGNAKIGGANFSYSVGEMALVNTIGSQNLKVTQGLLQPLTNAPTGTKDLVISQSQLTIYPNPTKDFVNIQPKFNSGGALQLTLLDLSGKVILQKKVTLTSGDEQQQIDMTTFANGGYMLNVYFDSKDGIRKNSYKIQKLNQ